MKINYVYVTPNPVSPITQMSTNPPTHEQYCTSCGTVHMFRTYDPTSSLPEPKLGLMSKPTCDCLWNCCVAATPQNRKHLQHKAIRKIVDPELYRIKASLPQRTKEQEELMDAAVKVATNAIKDSARNGKPVSKEGLVALETVGSFKHLVSYYAEMGV